MRVLECSSRGDKRFSAFYAMVEVNGVLASIEEHYQGVKRFNGQKFILERAKGKEVTSMMINGIDLPPTYLTQWYQLLWLKYFVRHPELLAYAHQFDDFHDMFKTKRMRNCQADIIRDIVRRGTGAVLKDCAELIQIIQYSNRVLV